MARLNKPIEGPKKPDTKIAKKVEAKFDEYLKAGFGDKEIPKQQKTEMKRAFMSGIFMGNDILIESMESGGNLEADFRNIYQYLDWFFKNECQ